MPVTVRTFATFSEAAAALSSDRTARYLGGGTLVMRALNEGDRIEPWETVLSVEGDYLVLLQGITARAFDWLIAAADVELI